MSNHLILNFRSLGSKPDANILEFSAVSVDISDTHVEEIASYTNCLERQEFGSMDQDSVFWWLSHHQIYANWRNSKKVSIGIVADDFARFIRDYTTPATTVWGNVPRLEETTKSLLSYSTINTAPKFFADFKTLLIISGARQHLIVPSSLDTARLTARWLAEPL